MIVGNSNWLLVRIACLAVVIGGGQPSAVWAQGDGSLGAEDVSHDGTPGYSAPQIRLLVGPIDGFTTVAHEVPATLAVPFYAEVELRVDARNLQPGQTIEWRGEGTVSDDGRSMRCRFRKFAPMDVAVRLLPDARPLTCTLVPAMVFPDWLQIEYDLSLAPPDVLTEEMTNEQTVSAFHEPSIAALTPVEGGFATSVDREVRFSCIAGSRFPRTRGLSPDALASLVEWRVDGQPVSLGAWDASFDVPGVRTIEVGPPGHAQRFELTAYDVTIASDYEDEILPEGPPITFYATTDPPGFEEHVTWLASTKYGTAEPTLGQGESFTATFEDTYGPGADGVLWQWVGVKADSADRGQDQKALAIEFCADAGFGFCAEPLEDYCVYAVERIVAGDVDGDGICDQEPRIFFDQPGPNPEVPRDAIVCVAPCKFPGEPDCIPHTFRVIGTNCVFTTRLLNVIGGDCSMCAGDSIWLRIE